MPYDGNELYDDGGIRYDEGERSSSSSLGLSSSSEGLSSSSLGLSSSSSYSSSSSSSEEDELAALDRRDICEAIKALFESDSTLYGSTGYINYITNDVVKFDQARVGTDRPYKMFIIATFREKIATRMGNNSDYSITVEYRIEGAQSNPQTAYDNVDDIDDRIDYLCSNEMWMGNNLSSHFTNSESSVIDIDVSSSNLEVRKDDGGWKIECNGSLRVEINRIKP